LPWPCCQDRQPHLARNFSTRPRGCLFRETRRSEKNPLFRHPILQQILPQGNQSATRIPAVLVMLSIVSSLRREERTCDANRRRFAHRKSALFKPMARKKQTNRAKLSRHGCLSHAIGTGWQSAATWRNRIPRHNTNIDLLFLLKLVKGLN
jgi:hypothetical protein